LAWSPDNKRIASTSFNTSVVWDTSHGKTLLTYHGHAANVKHHSLVA